MTLINIASTVTKRKLRYMPARAKVRKCFGCPANDMCVKLPALIALLNTQYTFKDDIQSLRVNAKSKYNIFQDLLVTLIPFHNIIGYHIF